MVVRGLAWMLVMLAGTVQAQGYDTGLGAWRGPLQFNLSVGGQRDAEAHRLAPVVVEIAPDGSFRGTSTEAGCKFLGLARQLGMPTAWTLDVTLSACTDARFNRRYSGTLTVHKSTREANLSLNAMQTSFLPGKTPSHAQLSAVLRR